MAGIYIHIPFCASRCSYCDFYSTTLRNKGEAYVDALVQEMDDRTDFLDSTDPIRTIYMGGGTPSQLSPVLINRILHEIGLRFDLTHLSEVTVEVNPEDVTPRWVEALCNQGTIINRISMGVQTFIDSELRLINRRHDSLRPAQAVALFRNAGITNISIDLIYALPTQTLASLHTSIDRALALAPTHLSAYCLSIEPHTALQQLVQAGTLTQPDEETTLAMAQCLRQRLIQAGYIQYEISNYALPGYESQHNSAYWTTEAYLGLGPGAHSYDGHHQRTCNMPDLQAYLQGDRSSFTETLSPTDLYNEAVMLGLRTSKGIHLDTLQTLLSHTEHSVSDHFVHQHQALINRGLLQIQHNCLCLTEEGLPLADEVIRTLFWVE